MKFCTKKVKPRNFIPTIISIKYKRNTNWFLNVQRYGNIVYMELLGKSSKQQSSVNQMLIGYEKLQPGAWWQAWNLPDGRRTQWKRQEREQNVSTTNVKTIAVIWLPRSVLYGITDFLLFKTQGRKSIEVRKRSRKEKISVWFTMKICQLWILEIK